MADDRERALRRAAELGLDFLAGLDERHVGALTDDLGLVAQLAGPLPDEGEDSVAVVEQMARDDPASATGRPPRPISTAPSTPSCERSPDPRIRSPIHVGM